MISVRWTCDKQISNSATLLKLLSAQTRVQQKSNKLLFDFLYAKREKTLQILKNVRGKFKNLNDANGGLIERFYEL